MKLIAMLVVSVVFLVTGCANSVVKKIDVYTFEEDRVDQQIHGNRGYVNGNVPEAPKRDTTAKRTFIGVDIELDKDLFTSKKERQSEAEEKISDIGKKVFTKQKPVQSEPVEEIIAGKGPKAIEGPVKSVSVANVNEEEEWIK